MRPSVESGPVNLARVLALEEQGLGLSVLEAEDLAVTTDVELALCLLSALYCVCACRCTSASAGNQWCVARLSPHPHVPCVRAVRGRAAQLQFRHGLGRTAGARAAERTLPG